MRLVKDDYCALPGQAQPRTRGGRDKVIVGAQDNVGGGGHLATEIIGAEATCLAQLSKILNVQHLSISVGVVPHKALHTMVPGGGGDALGPCRSLAAVAASCAPHARPAHSTPFAAAAADKRAAGLVDPGSL